MKKADAIFCGDIHLMERIPVARIDDFETAMWRKIKFINQLATTHSCNIYASGDFFEHWKPSPELLSKTVVALRGSKWYTIYGDHDLPQHSIKEKHKSGLTTLAEAGAITILNGGHGTNKNSSKLSTKKPSVIIKDKKIFLWHVLTWKTELPYPDCKTKNGKYLLKKYPQFDCIVTGDNHKPFIEEYKGRILINVGSMMRTRADQISYKPAVWLYYADTNTVVKEYLPIVDDVISREHIDNKEKRDNRISAFVERVNVKVDADLSLESNFEKVYRKNKIKKRIRRIITKAMQNDKRKDR